MKIISIQMALFSAELISRPDLLMNDVNERIGKVFDAMPMVMNLPPDVPSDIPLVQARSTNRVYSLNISRGRVDLTINPDYYAEKTPSDVMKEYKTLIGKYYKAVLNALKVVRVGVVLTLFEPVEENVRVVYEKYLKEPFSGESEVTVRINKQTLSKGLVYNNIRNVQAADLHVGNESITGVVIQLDTNNVPNNDLMLTAENISDIFGHATNKVKQRALKELI